MSGTTTRTATAGIPSVTDTMPPSHPSSDRIRALSLALWMLRAGPFLILILLVVALSFATPVFATSRNAGNILAQTAVIAIVALGQHLVILTRGIDLSVGSTLALASIVCPLA